MVLAYEWAQEAITNLNKVGISVELIDVQTLLPFDTYGVIGNSVRKTNRVVFLDEDFLVAAPHMLQQVFGKTRYIQILRQRTCNTGSQRTSRCIWQRW